MATEEISLALRAHVANHMPIRMVKLPEMELIERGDIYHHLLPLMSDISENLIRNKIKTTQWEKIKFMATKQDRRQRVIEDAIKERAKYAILSHTWLTNEREVTYPDWIAQKNLTGGGYAKLKNFCRVAHQNHGMTLAWLDTLCINKDSTSELDESIRSMYRWYFNSTICIIILADSKDMASVPKDRWFTRGWTLQELLAPRCIKFYSKNWKVLLDGDNDKGVDQKKGSDSDESDNGKSGLARFAPLIEKATGISLDELRFFDPNSSRRNIPTKMVWASKRITTREEDRAYCLMGIFGVSFSIAYGEGRERAFFRLLQAILSTYRDILAILDWSGKPIGDDVHATSLLPSGPECYKHMPGEPRLESYQWRDIEDYVPFSFAPQEPMTLTHLGLRVDLYCIPATVASIEEKDDVFTVSMQCGARFKEDPIEIKVYSHTVRRFDKDDDEGWGNEFLIGIWTFERDSQGTVYICSMGVPNHAFLLESNDPSQPIEMPRIWRKVDTPDPIRLLPDSPWKEDWDLDEIGLRTFTL